MFGKHVEAPQSHHAWLTLWIEVQADDGNDSQRISSQQQRLTGLIELVDARFVFFSQTLNELESLLERTNQESIQFLRLELCQPFNA